MGYYCCVPQCKSLSSKRSNVKFHRFPREKKLAEKWNEILMRKRPITRCSKVCSLHFRLEDYSNDRGMTLTKLNKNALPSLNLPRCGSNGQILNIRKKRETGGRKDMTEPLIWDTKFDEHPDKHHKRKPTPEEIIEMQQDIDEEAKKMNTPSFDDSIKEGRPKQLKTVPENVVIRFTTEVEARNKKHMKLNITPEIDKKQQIAQIPESTSKWPLNRNPLSRPSAALNDINSQLYSKDAQRNVSSSDLIMQQCPCTLVPIGAQGTQVNSKVRFLEVSGIQTDFSELQDPLALNIEYVDDYPRTEDSLNELKITACYSQATGYVEVEVNPKENTSVTNGSNGTMISSTQFDDD